MTILQTIHHKKNEIQEVEFFKDAECTEAFDFTNAKNLYIKPLCEDCTPIFALSNKLSGLGIEARIFTPIWNLGWRDGISPQTPLVTLNDVLDGEGSSNVNLSKYIPEDNAVLIPQTYQNINCSNKKLWFALYDGYIKYHDDSKRQLDTQTGAEYHKIIFNSIKSITIFLPHGTQSEIQKAKEILKELREKYGVEEVSLQVIDAKEIFEEYLNGNNLI